MRKQPAVAVAIIGQLQRLELRSKAINLAQPSQAAGLHLDFFFVLQSSNNGTASYSINHNMSAECHSKRLLPFEVMEVMRRLKLPVAAFELSSWSAWDHMHPAAKAWLADPTKNINPLHRELKTISDFRKMEMDAAYKARRAALLIEKHEVERGVTYDTVLYLRDDSVVTLPYVPPTPPLAHQWLSGDGLAKQMRSYVPRRKNWLSHDLLLRRSRLRSSLVKNYSASGAALYADWETHMVPGCHVKDCHDWGGVANKVFVCARQHLQPLLRSAWEDVNLGLPYHPSGPTFSTSTSEVWLKRIFDAYQTPLRAVDPEELPIVVARVPCRCGVRQGDLENAPWCLISNEQRDCHPRGLPAVTPMFTAVWTGAVL